MAIDIESSTYVNKRFEGKPTDRNHQMKPHTIEDCISHLKAQSSSEQVPKVLDFVKGVEESGLDPLLGTFSNLLQRETIPHILSFLRTFGVLDVSDCERITNKCVNQTTDEEIMAMVNILNTKGPHAFWYCVHALQRVQPQFFMQMHGELVCCVCDEVAQNYDLMGQETEQELADGASAETSLQCSKQRVVLNDLLARVEQLRVSFSSLENSISEIVERIKPFPHITDNLSQRFRNEIKDVMTHSYTDGEIGAHTNVNVIKRLKVKCLQLGRQIESSFYSNSRDVQDNAVAREIKSDTLKEVVCKAPNPCEDVSPGSKEFLPCRTYEDVWIEFEDRCFAGLSQCNPWNVIQKSLGEILLFGQRYKRQVCFAFGISMCIKVVGSYLLEYSQWTEGPRSLLG